jgi:hypothetical protein
MSDQILRTMGNYFDLLTRKWQCGWESSYFSVGDMLEEEWDFACGVSQLIRGADVLAATRFCQLSEAMLSRMNVELEQSSRVLPGYREGAPPVAGAPSADAAPTRTAEFGTTPRETVRRINRLIETFRWRARRILRFSKRISSQLEVRIAAHGSPSFFCRGEAGAGVERVRDEGVGKSPASERD